MISIAFHSSKWKVTVFYKYYKAHSIIIIKNNILADAI